MLIKKKYSHNRGKTESQLHVTKPTVNTLFLVFNLVLCPMFLKSQYFFEYAPQQFFSELAVDAKQQVDRNNNSNVVAEPMKILAISSHTYQVMDWNLHNFRRCLNGKTTNSTT